MGLFDDIDNIAEEEEEDEGGKEEGNEEEGAKKEEDNGSDDSGENGKKKTEAGKDDVKSLHKEIKKLSKIVKDSQSHISRIENENKELRDFRQRITGTGNDDEEKKINEENLRLNDLFASNPAEAVKEIVSKAVNKTIAPINERMDITTANLVGEEVKKKILQRYDFPFDDNVIRKKFLNELFYIPLEMKRRDPEGAILRACRNVDEGKHLKKLDVPRFESGGSKRPIKIPTRAEIIKKNIQEAKRVRVLEM